MPGLLWRRSFTGLATSDSALPATAKSEPMYEASDATHVLHHEETWENLADIADFESFTRTFGPALNDRGIVAYGDVVDEPDDFGSVKHVTTDYHSDPPIPAHGTGAHAAGAHWPGAETGDFQGFDSATGNPNGAVNRGFDIASFSNTSTQKDSVVYEFAVRYRGTNAYEGKCFDINSGQGGGVGRFNYEHFRSNLGIGGTSSCTDAMCTTLYSGNGTVPLRSGLLPDHKQNALSFSRSQSAGNLSSASGASTHWIKQNLNWGTGAGAFARGTGNSAGWGQNGTDTHNNADLTGTGTILIEAGWLYHKIRITKEPDDASYQYGRGRIEGWVGSLASSTGPGSMVKTFEYFGDVGEEMEDLIWIAPSYADKILGNVHVYSLSSQVYRGGALVDIGYSRVWSHPRIAL